MKIDWKLVALFIITIVGVSVMDHFTGWMKVLWIMIIIGGTIFSALTSDTPSKQNTSEVKG